MTTPLDEFDVVVCADNTLAIKGESDQLTVVANEPLHVSEELAEAWLEATGNKQVVPKEYND